MQEEQRDFCHKRTAEKIRAEMGLTKTLDKFGLEQPVKRK